MLINWQRYLLCAHPLHIWIVVHYSQLLKLSSPLSTSFSYSPKLYEMYVFQIVTKYNEALESTICTRRAKSHVFGLALPLPRLPARTCVGTPPCWEPISQYMVKIINIQVDITFIIPKLIDGVPSHAKGAQWLQWPHIVTLVPNEEEFPRRCRQEDLTIKEA